MPRHKRPVSAGDIDKPLVLNRETRLILAGCGRLGCSLDEVAGMFRVYPEAIQSWFKADPLAKRLFQESRMEGKIGLRRKQYRLADKSAAMAIFLGKNELGQSDRTDIQHSGGLDVSIRVVKYEDVIDVTPDPLQVAKPSDGAS